MSNKPHPLSEAEIKEIAGLVDIQEMWGAENADEMADILSTMTYAVRFDFHSGGPGYVGDYFVIAGDALGEPVQLIRKEGALALL